jgi:hypothetical protein
VLQPYIDYILSRPGKLWIEQRVNATRYHPELFGTLDAGIWSEQFSLLEVVDLKTGSGLYVKAQENVQLLLYAVMLCETFHLRPERVRLTIVQPRYQCDEGPIRTWELSIAEMDARMDELAKAARATDHPDAPLVAGSWCRWCPAEAVCPALQQETELMAQTEFSNQLVPAFDADGRPVQNLGYDPQELSDALAMIPRLRARIEAVQAFAYGEAIHGRPPPGYKLVNKKLGNRKWKNEAETIRTLEMLASEDFDFASIYSKPELRSPAQIEKLLSKEEAEVLEALVTRESTGVCLVEESDPRPAVASAPELDFTKLEDTDHD